ncbi:low molecular weight phosphotyrosine protein phosphatase [Monosporozyma servazzii]
MQARMTQGHKDKKLAVAFVCLGNICRSPMAEAVFAHTVKTQDLESRFSRIESFGTARYHIGESPDERSASTCRDNGVPVDHKAQQIKDHHFKEFDYVICMDESNLNNLRRICKDKSLLNKIYLFGHWNTDGKYNKIVDDPYYGGIDGFQYNFNQVKYFSEEFLKTEL